VDGATDHALDRPQPPEHDRHPHPHRNV
jgi:hypothetical protein